MMRVIELKSGETVVIREAVEDDACAMIDYLDMGAGETDFLTFGPGEFTLTSDQEVGAIRDLRNVYSFRNFLE